MYCVPTLTSTIVQVVINVLNYSFVFFFVYSLQTEISFSCMIFHSKEYAFNGTTKLTMIMNTESCVTVSSLCMNKTK